MDFSDNCVRIAAILIAGGIEISLICTHQDGAFLVPVLLFIGALFPGINLAKILK